MIRDCKELQEYLCEEIKKHADIAIIGISGGADSTLVTLLCAEALGKENVYGISMPYNKHDQETFNSRSAAVADKLGINHLVRPVSKIANAINEQAYVNDPSDLTDVNSGNARSRARMCVLYGLSHSISTKHDGKRVRVIGTGNLSEDFIGYDTKGGDALADFFPIGELFKSEVYQFLEFFRDKGVIEEGDIDRIPAAGLEDDQTDEGDLGYSYDSMEKPIRFCLENYSSMDERKDLDEITRFVWQRHKQHKHKHEGTPLIKLRMLCV